MQDLFDQPDTTREQLEEAIARQHAHTKQLLEDGKRVAVQLLFARHLCLYLCQMRVLQRAAHRTRRIFAQIARQNARLSAHPMQFRCAACLLIALIPLLLLQIACLLFIQLFLTLCQFRKQIPLAFQLLFPLGCLSPVAAQRFLSHLTGM